MLLPLIRLERTSFILIASIMAGFSVFWFTIVTGVMIFIPNAGSVPLMLHWLLSFLGMMMTAIQGMSLCYRFLSQGVRMGQTRKTMLVHLSAILSLFVVIQYLLITLFCAIEEFLVYNVWMNMQPNLVVEMTDKMDAWWALPAMLALGVAVALVGGALFLKLGPRNAGRIFLITWLSFMALANSEKMISFVTNKHLTLGLAIVLGVGSLIWAIYHYLHMSVREG